MFGTRFRVIFSARWLRQLRARQALTVSGLAVLLTTVEVLGRRLARSDAHDAVAVGILAVALMLVHSAGGFSAVVVRLLRRLGSVWRRCQFDFGVDLRHTPAIPKQLPPALALGFLVFVTVLPTVLVGATVLGWHPRSLANVFYLGHALGLMLLWASLAAASVLLLLVAIASIHDWHTARFRGSGRRPRLLETVTQVTYLVLLITGARVLPAWTPAALAGLALLLVLGYIWWPGGPQLSVLWRSRIGRRTIRVADWRNLESIWVATGIFAFLDLFLLAHGGAALGLVDGVESLPLTNGLRAVFAWVSAPALVLFAVLSGSVMLAQRRQDPARPFPMMLHASGVGLDREFLANLAAARGWRLRLMPYPPQPSDVCINMVPSPMPPLSRPPRWPLTVSSRALELPELQDLLERRDVVQRRRALVRGFRYLLKRAARRRFQRGSGFWLAPHQWFISGMSRDTDDDSSTDMGDAAVITHLVGPLYTRLFPLAARQHLHQVLKTLDVDLVFLEDSVGYRGFRLVLHRLFKHYDAEASTLQDQHLTGLTGIRCVIHDYDFDNPWRQRGYPEVDYEELGRARILHIFRDRGQTDVIPDSPIDIDRLLLTV